MVELGELKLMPTDSDNCYWPPDIDEHVAQLDFGDASSMMMDGQSVFGSVMMADPSLISTDSLDMEMLRFRCENNKHNDYKLTFEDSGQWTTSGIGGSFTTTNTTASPPTPQTGRRVLNYLAPRNKPQCPLLPQDRDNHNLLQLLDELNNGHGGSNEVDNNEKSTGTAAIQWRNKLLDEILNNNGNADDTSAAGQIKFGELTTWGRIRSSTEQEQQAPPFDDKVNSLPELNKSRQEKYIVFNKGNSSPTISPKGSGNYNQSKRPSSLISHFIEESKQPTNDAQQQHQSTPPMDYEYSEVQLDDGRYIDMNENEIGYVPPSTAPIQSGKNQKASGSGGATRSASSMMNNPGLPPIPPSSSSTKSSPRTFADLSPSKTAPDLKFIALSHKIPSICATSRSFDDLLKRAKGSNLDELLDCCLSTEKALFSQEDESSEAPDSGVGSSSSDGGGPSHIEDWPSLSVLLPRNVVEACSFFKTNSFLLTGSSNNIEHHRRCPPRSFTSAGIRRLSRWEEGHHRPLTACNTCLCSSSGDSLDITQSAMLPQQKQNNGVQSPRRQSQKLRLHAKELALIGLPLYDKKRNLIERVVEGVAEIIRGASSIILLSALEKLMADGLKQNVTSWEVIRRVTGPGPVTASVFQMIEELEVSEKPPNSRVSHFFQRLLGLHSMDAWFSYIVLKEATLRQFYKDDAFFIGAQNSYRSLFARFVECLELLSVLNQCGNTGRKLQQKRKQYSLNSMDQQKYSAAKMPNDSRVPKSSSLPTKLSNILKDAGNDAEKYRAATNIPTIFEPEVEESHNRQNAKLIKPSRIPIARSRSRSSHSMMSTHSTSFRKTPPRFCHVREAVNELDGSSTNGDCAEGTMLPVEKGECLKVLSIRGPYSRCSRLRIEPRGLAIWNGVCPTEKLEFL